MAKRTSYIKAYSGSSLNVAQNSAVESGWIRSRHGDITGLGLKVTGTGADVRVDFKTKTEAGVETEYVAGNVLASTNGSTYWPTKTAYNEMPLTALRAGIWYKFKFTNLSASAMTALEARLIRTWE